MTKRKADGDALGGQGRAGKPAAVTASEQAGQQQLQEPFVDLSTYERLSQGAEAVR